MPLPDCKAARLKSRPTEKPLLDCKAAARLKSRPPEKPPSIQAIYHCACRLCRLCSTFINPYHHYPAIRNLPRLRIRAYSIITPRLYAPTKSSLLPLEAAVEITYPHICD